MLSQVYGSFLLLIAIRMVAGGAQSWGMPYTPGSCNEDCEHHCDISTGLCACRDGYKLAKDEIHCIDINECDIDNGGCGQTCINLYGSHQCICEVTCRAGYTLHKDACVDSCKVYGCSHNCTKDSDGNPMCGCPANGKLSPNGKNCIDPCKFSNGGCSHTCASNHETLMVTCTCPAGYELDDTGKRCEMNRIECADLLRQEYDPTLRKCVNKCDKLQCEHKCEIDIQSGRAKCVCNPGYKLKADKLQCSDVDECAVDKGGCAENCTNTAGSYECSCIRGELNTDRHTCTVINPCENTDNGGCNHICRHIAHRSSRCLCRQGYVLQDDQKTCISKCEVDNGECGGATCNLTSEGVVTCSCPDQVMLNSGTDCAPPCTHPGYELNMDTGKCRSLCSTPDNGGCSDGCSITHFGVLCSCPSGLELMSTGKCIDCGDGHHLVNDTCQDIDECAEKTDKCEQLCKNTVGGYNCSCSTGELDINGKDCTTVNVCESESKGNCSQLCIHVAHREYHCACREGYVLDTDLRTCVSLCDINNGGCEESCKLEGGNATCGCDHGYVLVNQTHCKDVCDLDVCDQVCTHTDPEANTTNPRNPYKCSCSPGYILSDGKCTERCSVDNYGCVNGTCVNHYDGSYFCKCNPFRVLQADNLTCSDKNECLESNGQCSGECVNKDPGHECKCTKGELDVDRKTCVEINVCEKPHENHRCSQLCVHVRHRMYRCECEAGYELADDGITCINICKVDNGGCDHKCTLVNGTGAVCSCNTGYKLADDKLSCVDIDECEEGSSACAMNCTNTEGSYTCTCPPGWHLDTDEHGCTDIDVCKVDNGGCSHTCKDMAGLAYICTCPADMALKNDTKTCEDKCKLDNGGCEETCTVGGISGVISCSCPTGYQLQIDRKSCVDIDECKESVDTCEDICENQPGGYICLCASGYTADATGACIDDDECKNGEANCSHHCTNTPGSFHCSCDEGYELSADGKTCTDIDECDVTDARNRVCDQYCTNSPGSYNCSCRSGFTLVNKVNCTDIPECSTKNGGCAQVCHELVGAYKCSCHKGYKLNTDFRTCDDIDECSTNNGGCTHRCSNTEGSFTCSCYEGYLLSNDRKTCHDVNECDNKNGGCSDICVNKPGSHHCDCPTGYSLDYDNRTCVDMDECHTNNGGCETHCKNTLGAYNCSCDTGYILAADHLACDDINECTKKLDNCQQLCVNNPGSFDCACSLGYELAEDGHSCSEIDRCKNANGGCEHVCKSTKLKPVCSCRPGYELAHDKTSCNDIDECAQPDTGGCRQVCINLNGTYRCECDDTVNICLDGYEHQPLTGQCLDIDECKENLADCLANEECENLRGINGKYQCVTAGSGENASSASSHTERLANSSGHIGGSETKGSASGTEEPGSGTEESGSGTEEPGSGTEEPGSGTEEPGSGTEEPVSGTEESATGNEGLENGSR